jgi:hypothetical protein
MHLSRSHKACIQDNFARVGALVSAVTIFTLLLILESLVEIYFHFPDFRISTYLQTFDK